MRASVITSFDSGNNRYDVTLRPISKYFIVCTRTSSNCTYKQQFCHVIGLRRLYRLKQFLFIFHQIRPRVRGESAHDGVCCHGAAGNFFKMKVNFDYFVLNIIFMMVSL